MREQCQRQARRTTRKRLILKQEGELLSIPHTFRGNSSSSLNHNSNNTNTSNQINKSHHLLFRKTCHRSSNNPSLDLKKSCIHIIIMPHRHHHIIITIYRLLIIPIIIIHPTPPLQQLFIIQCLILFIIHLLSSNNNNSHSQLMFQNNNSNNSRHHIAVVGIRHDCQYDGSRCQISTVELGYHNEAERSRSERVDINNGKKRCI
mmetsp:Transcript_41706/g.50782  ORF Transcript_41706/g.50782 Transcript_41706/m.50782 type:complete len:204 (+) Transcript_41706:75-686(+)